MRCGGGFNHRLGLDDAMLIKDNHIAVAGGMRGVLERARAVAGHLVKIEIEVDTLDQLAEVLDTGLADAVLLDNMSVADMRKAVEMTAGRAAARSLRRHHPRHHRGGGRDRRRLRVVRLDHAFGARRSTSRSISRCKFS